METSATDIGQRRLAVGARTDACGRRSRLHKRFNSPFEQTPLEAAHLVQGLNFAMQRLNHPGRRNATGRASAVDFSQRPGG